MSSINFDNIYLLLIAIPIIVLVAVPFAVAVRKENRNWHNIASMVLHVCMAVLIGFTAAGTSVVTTITETDVFVVADVSYSAEKNLDTIDNYITKLGKNLPRNSKMGLVCFGKDYEIVTAMGGTMKSVKTASVDQSETNIVQALEYTGRLFEEDVLKRIVLITDGKQTDNGDSNALKRAVDGLALNNIRVDAIYLDDNIAMYEEGGGTYAKEVQLSGAELTGATYLNHSERVNVIIQSSFITNGTVTLYKDGEQYGDSKPVLLSPGTNTVSFDLYTDEKGTFDYEAKITAEGDESPHNNTYGFSQTVTDEVKVLLITSTRSERQTATALYGDKAKISAYYLTDKIPYTVEQLCEYDEIMFVNADIGKIENVDMFVESLDTVVSRFGKSLVTIGDTGIQSHQDISAAKKLGNMLPVKYGTNDQDPKLYTLVLDMSRSMDFLYKLDRAKKASAHILTTLADNDYICVVGFYGDYRIIQQPVRAVNREAITKTINNLSGKQGTLIGTGMKQALNSIGAYSSRFSEKQVMLITDGLQNSADSEDPIAVAQDMLKEGIVSSVIDVGRGAGDNDLPAAQGAVQLLKNIAAAGGGSYFLADTDAKLTDILFGPIDNKMTETEITSRSFITVERRYDAAADNINFENVTVRGFLNSTKKPSASTVLSVNYTKKSTGADVTVPLYAHWDYGNGKVASYTSQLSGNWATLADSSSVPEQYGEFFGRIFSTNIPEEKTDYPYAMDVIRDGKNVRVEIAPAALYAEASASVNLTFPDGTTKEADFSTEGNIYYYEFSADGVGKYQIDVVYSYGQREYPAHYSFDIAYEPEYDSFAVYDASELYKAVSGNGIVSEDGNLKIENDKDDVATYTVSLVLPLLIVCVVLYVADIIIRKLKWEDIRSLFKRTK